MKGRSNDILSLSTCGQVISSSGGKLGTGTIKIGSDSTGVGGPAARLKLGRVSDMLEAIVDDAFERVKLPSWRLTSEDCVKRVAAVPRPSREEDDVARGSLGSRGKPSGKWPEFRSADFGEPSCAAGDFPLPRGRTCSSKRGLPAVPAE